MLFLSVPTYAAIFVEIPLLFHLVEVDGVWLVVVFFRFLVALNEFDFDRRVGDVDNLVLLFVELLP